MATWEDVDRLVAALPGTGTRGPHEWRVGTKPLAWERPLRTKDLEELGASAPDGPILGVRTPGEAGKLELIADSPEVYFTTSHFDGYPAVLIRLPEIAVDELAEVLTDAWRAQAPKRLQKEHPEI
jgi:hypothetical protein